MRCRLLNELWMFNAALVFMVVGCVCVCWGGGCSYLRMQSSACVKTCGAMPCSCCRIRHCSSVTDMAVRSLALLQLVKRTPFSRRQI